MADSCSGEGATHYACDCTLRRLAKAEALADAVRALLNPDVRSQLDAIDEAEAALAAWEGRTDAVAAVGGEKEESDAD